MNKADSSFLTAKLLTIVGQKRLRMREDTGKRGGKFHICVYKHRRRKYYVGPLNFNELFKQCTRPPLPSQILSSQI